jgi:hypothetical protein
MQEIILFQDIDTRLSKNNSLKIYKLKMFFRRIFEYVYESEEYYES